MTKLAQHDCQGTCAWGRTERSLDGEPLFECASCHSEWVPSESWTPRNADGEIPAAVLAVKPPAPATDEDDFIF